MKGKWYLFALSALLGVLFSFQGLTGLFVFVTIALFFNLYRQYEFRKQCICYCLVTFFLFYFMSTLADEHNRTIYLGDETTFVGKISSMPIIDGDRLTFRFKTSHSENLQLVYYIKSEQELKKLQDLSYGMTCIIEGKLRKPSPATNFYAFDYKEYLYKQKTHWLFTPHTFSTQQCSNKNPTLYDRLQQIRHLGLLYIQKNYPKELVGIVSALVFGERTDIDQDLLSAYQALGVIHLLAVSGLHVGLVFTTLYFISIRIGVTKERTLELLMLLLPLYMIIAGGAPSVIRASGMTFVVLLALRIRKKVHPLDGISVVFLILLFFHPYYLFQLGFQLSFIVSFSLIVSAQVIVKRYSNYLAQLMVVTLISQFVSFPIILWNFYEISIWSLPLNLIYIPFISLMVLPLSFLSLFISFLFPLIGEVMIIILQQGIAVAHHILATLYSLKYGQLLFGKPPLFMMILLYCSITYGFLCWEKCVAFKSNYKPIAFFVFICILQWNLPYLTSTGEVTVLDVGQGDSIFIELPYRKEVYVIDTGGIVKFGENEQWQERRKNFDVGHDIVLPYLKAKGVRRVDRLILTHGHFDHIGGAKALIENVKIDDLLYSASTITDFSDFEKELFIDAHRSKVTIQFVQEGEHWVDGDVPFYILSPNKEEQTVNNGSVVMIAKIGGLNWLFTGDLEETGEKRIIRTYPTLPVDILKVGHHGSRTSSTPEFINHIQPRLALISAGRNNRFGHPHKEVTDYLEEKEIDILRTDQVGAIRYHFKENRGTFEWMIK